DRDALVDARAEIQQKWVSSRVDDQRHTAPTRRIACGSDSSALLVDVEQSCRVIVVRGILEIDPNRAGIENLDDCLRNVGRTGPIAALDIRADWNRYRLHDCRDRANHCAAIDLFGVLISLGVRNSSARGSDRAESGLLEDSSARSVPGVRQQQSADVVLLAKLRRAQSQ